MAKLNDHSNVMNPVLNIPPSTVSVSVKIIDIATISNVPADAIVTPPVPGIKTFAPSPTFIFLLEHPSGQKVLYDLGIRKDWENLAPEIVERFKKTGHKPIVEKNASDFLDEAGVGRENIDAVIWSHAHWDHIGDMSTFGPSTELIVGPGFKDHFLGRGASDSPLGQVLPSDVQGRNVREITFEDPPALRIGKFPAHDYFGDGSLYLLASPGHCVGHICALVRTTTNPDTFIFLGGDAAHHCAEFRPSEYLPMPKSITPNPVDLHNRQIPFCPGSWFEDLQISRKRDPQGPLWKPSFGHNMDEVLLTIGKMQDCDANDNVFVIIAHDSGLRSPDVPTFPESVNDWQIRGLGEKFRWTWIGDIIAALKVEA